MLADRDTPLAEHWPRACHRLRERYIVAIPVVCSLKAEIVVKMRPAETVHERAGSSFIKGNGRTPGFLIPGRSASGKLCQSWPAAGKPNGLGVQVSDPDQKEK